MYLSNNILINFPIMRSNDSISTICPNIGMLIQILIGIDGAVIDTVLHNIGFI